MIASQQPWSGIKVSRSSAGGARNNPDMADVKSVTKRPDAPIAFVAMKFDGDAWRDKRYQVIKEVMEEAGYRPVRADEVPTSGGVVEEICRQLREAPLVVIDSSGDSHSVSYEIGYCHGVGRKSSDVILLRNGPDIPFNFRHYRHRCYRDLRHLRRLLREWFQLSRPISDRDCGYGFVIGGKRPGLVHGQLVADILLRILREISFSGRVEYFAADRQLSNFDHYVVGLGIRARGKAVLGWEGWSRVRTLLERELKERGQGLYLDENLTEMSSMASVRSLPARGVAEFDEGEPARVINPEAANSDSWFIARVREVLGEGSGPPRTPDPAYKLAVFQPVPGLVTTVQLPSSGSSTEK
jgi:hypothetical protein